MELLKVESGNRTMNCSLRCNGDGESNISGCKASARSFLSSIPSSHPRPRLPDWRTSQKRCIPTVYLLASFLRWRSIYSSTKISTSSTERADEEDRSQYPGLGWTSMLYSCLLFLSLLYCHILPCVINFP